MKPYLLLLILGFSALPVVYAQQHDNLPSKKNLWRTEVGPAFTGTGDMWGSLLSVEYGRYLTKCFRVSPAVGVWLFQNQEAGPVSLRRTATARSLDLTGYYEITPQHRVSIEVGAGAFVRNWKRGYATGPTTGFPNGMLYLPPDSYNAGDENTLGYTLSAGALVRLSGAIGWNARATLQNDTGGNTALTARAGFTIRF